MRIGGVGAVLGQVAVTRKSNEIRVVRDLLRTFADLASAIITMGALHIQGDTAQVIRDRHTDYVMTVRGHHAHPCTGNRRSCHPQPFARDRGPRQQGPPAAGPRPRWRLPGPGSPAPPQVEQLRRTLTWNGGRPSMSCT
jgi:hypothetical protein